MKPELIIGREYSVKISKYTKPEVGKLEKLTTGELYFAMNGSIQFVDSVFSYEPYIPTPDIKDAIPVKIDLSSQSQNKDIDYSHIFNKKTGCIKRESWQVCPYCSGKGTKGIWKKKMCLVCKGKRIINIQTGRPPE